MSKDSTEEDSIGLIYESARNAEASDDALAACAEQIGATSAALLRLADDRRRDLTLARFGMEREAVIDLASTRDLPESPLAGWCSGAVGEIFASGDGRAMIGIVDTRDAHVYLLMFLRPENADIFSDATREVFGELLPHWRRALSIKELLDNHRAELHAADRILNQAPYGLFLLDGKGQILHTNTLAEQICERNDGLAMSDGRLEFRVHEYAGMLEEMLAQVRKSNRESADELRPFSMPKSSGDGTYQFRMMRLRIPVRHRSLAEKNVIGIYVLDTSRPVDVRTDDLQSLYGLTVAEARVCELLYRSRNLTEAAQIIGISVNTAKTHLLRSFRKIGVQSQPELMRRLSLQLYSG